MTPRRRKRSCQSGSAGARGRLTLPEGERRHPRGWRKCVLYATEVVISWCVTVGGFAWFSSFMVFYLGLLGFCCYYNFARCSRGCLKVYHPTCVNRDQAFIHSQSRWECGKFKFPEFLLLSYVHWSVSACSIGNGICLLLWLLPS